MLVDAQFAQIHRQQPTSDPGITEAADHGEVSGAG
jgi:hypothetical protein